MGLCKRFPEQQNKHSTDWCGEHLAIKETTITLPKPDLEIDQTEKKKLGRPPKNIGG